MERAATDGAQRSNRKAVRVLLGTLLLGAMMVGAVLLLIRARRGTIDDALEAFARGDVATASQIVEPLLRQPQPDNKTLVLAARLATLRERPDEAIVLLRRVVDEGKASFDQLLECGTLCGQIGWLADAEHYLRMALGHQPEHPDANTRMLDLLRMEGRNWEARPFAAALFRQRQFTAEHLELVGTLNKTWVSKDRDGAFLAHCERIDPESVLPQLGLIRVMLEEQHNVDDAELALAAGVAASPELLEAQLALGELLLEAGHEERFLAWHAKLPEQIDQHPGIWTIRGRWQHRKQNDEAAARCLWESIRRFPHERGANLLLAQLLVALGRDADADAFRKQGELLVAFDDLLVRPTGRTPEDLVRMIEILERLERRWEAFGWCQVLLEAKPDSDAARQTAERLEPTLPKTVFPLSVNPASTVDLSAYPLPRWPATAKLAVANDIVDSADEPAFSFRDSANERGLDFRYFIDQPRLQKAVYTFDFSGGGVGVIDFDLDGLPDLYLTQARHVPPAENGDQPRNALYRNLGSKFVDVAAAAGVGDQQFGQGTAVGDFNSDGFPDLYVANLGANVLYVNNGDGTFADISVPSGTAGAGYSLSAAFADFNGDGLADLYVANYLGGDAMQRQCESKGQRVQCGPYLFPGQVDQLYLNLGNGQFRDVAAEAGIVAAQDSGRGMGLLIADFDGRNGLDVYVANDMMVNHLYLNQGTTLNQGTIDVPTFVEQGQRSGVAYNGRGTLQGSMGIAAADVNQDGMLDLYVTNFYKESNNFFTQLMQGQIALFDDRSNDAKLAGPSFDMMGWGAQFLDADLDGDWDLFVANGDLDEKQVGKMLPQLFENRGEAPFRLSAPSCDYLRTKAFGRAVARLDWNRDGLPDLCVTHRGDPFALLTNTTSRHGHFLSLTLKGVECSRDAIGAVVFVEAGSRTWTVPLVAGDGFSASNQKQLLIGLGDVAEVDKVTVRWPGGTPQQLEQLAVDRHWIVVQGRPPWLDAPTPLGP